MDWIEKGKWWNLKWQANGGLKNKKEKIDQWISEQSTGGKNESVTKAE